MMLAFMDEAFQHIKEQLDSSKHEVIFRYDCKKSEMACTYLPVGQACKQWKRCIVQN